MTETISRAGSASAGGAVRAGAGATVTTIACVLPVFLVGGLAVQLGDELGFSPAGLGLAVSVYFGVSALASVPSGALVERYGPAPVARAGVLLSAGSMLAVAALARSYPLLVALLAVGATANALGQLASNAALAARVPTRRQGLSFGVKQAAIPVSTLLAGVAVPTVALTAGWRWAFVAAAGAALRRARVVRRVTAGVWSAPAGVRRVVTGLLRGWAPGHPSSASSGARRARGRMRAPCARSSQVRAVRLARENPVPCLDANRTGAPRLEADVDHARPEGERARNRPGCMPPARTPAGVPSPQPCRRTRVPPLGPAPAALNEDPVYVVPGRAAAPPSWAVAVTRTAWAEPVRPVTALGTAVPANGVAARPTDVTTVGAGPASAEAMAACASRRRRFQAPRSPSK